jgi:nicotinate-nucleotide adenylyltransferase
MRSEPAPEPLGIFGGTFDPVHFGHLRLAEEAADILGLRRVRWIPAGRPFLRDTPRVGPRQRLEMVRLAIAGNPRFELDPAEIDTPGTSYTVPTLERLRQREVRGADRPLVLLLGNDAFAGLAGWYRWQRLFELAHVAVAHRPGYPVGPDLLPPELAAVFRRRLCEDHGQLSTTPAGHIVLFALTPLDISATRIRSRLQNSQSARYLMPDSVIAHIHQHRFYMETESPMKVAETERIVVAALADLKGKDIEVIDTRKLTPLFERIVVASGDSARHVRSLARHVEDKAREAGVEVLSMEGEDSGEWVLVDLGDVVAHVMQPAVRAYYNLEELWGDRGPERVRKALCNVEK